MVTGLLHKGLLQPKPKPQARYKTTKQHSKQSSSKRQDTTSPHLSRMEEIHVVTEEVGISEFFPLRNTSEARRPVGVPATMF